MAERIARQLSDRLGEEHVTGRPAWLAVGANVLGPEVIREKLVRRGIERFEIDHVEIDHGRVAFDDQRENYRNAMDDIVLALDAASTTRRIAPSSRSALK